MEIKIIAFIILILFNYLVWFVLPQLSKQKHEKEMLKIKHKNELRMMIFNHRVSSILRHSSLVIRNLSEAEGAA